MELSERTERHDYGLDPRAPEGSPKWCNARRVSLARQLCFSEEVDIGLQEAWDECLSAEVWLNGDPRYDHFSDWAAQPYPDGLGPNPKRPDFKPEIARQRFGKMLKDGLRALELGPPPNVGKAKGTISSLEPKTERAGTSRTATIRQLIKADRQDLVDAVVSKKMSANAAAIEAGIRKKPTPLDRLRTAWRKATRAERLEFHEWIELEKEK